LTKTEIKPKLFPSVKWREQMDVCSVAGCHGEVLAKGLCSKHYDRLRARGRLERTAVENKGVTCKERGCDEWAHALGYCRKHYLRMWRHNRVGPRRTKRDHPLYSHWWQRKKQGMLCEKWLDFYLFVNDVGERPGKNYTLVRLKWDEPYGPDNCEWREHLCRKDDESTKQWHARKWRSRRKGFPTYERDRYYRRKYGIGPEHYDMMLNAQEGVCAICSQKETAIDVKTGQIKRLAIDHDHKTGDIRGLLCGVCNRMIAQIDKWGINLLQVVELYLKRNLQLHCRDGVVYAGLFKSGDDDVPKTVGNTMNSAS
jgi:hypothetical protein